MKNKIFHELREHIPFTGVASLAAVVLVAIGFLLNKEAVLSYSGNLFEIFHPLHLFFSAIVSSAIFYKYHEVSGSRLRDDQDSFGKKSWHKKKIFMAIIIGLLISLILGTLSDIIFPYFGGIVFGLETGFHFAVFESPLLILGAALIGALVGVFGSKTKIPHFMHVLLSVLASLLYLLAFSISVSFVSLIFVFLIIFISVIVPCCLSDIIFPVMVAGRGEGK